MSDELDSEQLYGRAPPVVQRLARWLRSTNRWTPTRSVGLRLNRALLGGSAWLLSRRRGVRSVLARHSVLTEDFVPWVSDLDLDVVIADDADSLPTVRGIWQSFAWLKRCYPLFGELEVQSERELAAWQRWGGVEASEARHWTLLAGEMSRPPNEPPSDLASQVSLAVEALNLLYWQLYGIVFSPSFGGDAFCKVFAKLYRVLTGPPASAQLGPPRSRKAVLAELRQAQPDLARRLDDIAARHYERIEPDLLVPLQRLMDALLQVLPAVPPEVAQVPLAVSMAHERPTRELVLGLLRPALEELRSIDGISEVALVSGRLGDSGALGSYDYKLYLCLAEEHAGGWAEQLARVRVIFDRHRRHWPFNYFGACSLPVLVPERAFRFAVQHWDPFEGIELALRKQEPVAPSPLFVPRSLAYFCNSNRHHRGFAFNRPFTDRIREDFGAELTLVDYVLTLAQLRLALVHRHVAITPADVVERYRGLLPEPHELGQELADWLQRYGALRPADMPHALSMDRLVAEAQPIITRQKDALFAWLMRCGPR